MAVFRIRFVGPAVLAVRVATELADADGVDLTSSEPPTPLGDAIELTMTVDGTRTNIDRALEQISGDLPDGASIAVAG